MKKIILMIATLILLFGYTACKDDDNQPPNLPSPLTNCDELQENLLVGE